MDFSKLSKTTDSLDKLNEFINVSSSDTEIIEASFYMAKISFELNRYDDALKIISKNITDELKAKDKEMYHKFLDLLIKMYTDTYNLNEAIKWIGKKRDSLAVLDIYKADILLLEVYIKGRDDVKAISLAKNLLNEQIDIAEKTYILKYLVEYYFKLEMYDDALLYVRKLKENTYELDNYNYYYAIYYEAFCSYQVKEYKQALKANNECLENILFITDELLVKAYVLDLMIHVALKEYKKATLKETEYESAVMDSTYENKVLFYKACIELYTNDFNKPSLELYKERLETLEKPNEEDIKQYRIDLKPIKIKEEKEVKKEDAKQDKNTIYTIINDINDIGSKVYEKGIKPKLRDNIIHILDKASEYVKFDVSVIVYNNRRFDGFFYKKNRLYEKDFKDIKNTVIYDTLKNRKEMLYQSLDELAGKRDIYLDTLYENTDIEHLITFPIFEEEKIIAVIYFYKFSRDLINGYNYEILKYASLLIGDRIVSKNIMQELVNENNAYTNAFMDSDVALKYMIDDNVYLNKKAANMLKQKTKLKLNEYMINIPSDEYRLYREYLDSDVTEFRYRYDELDILEVKKKNNNEILSILSDNSNTARIERKENDLIYLDSETRTKNMYSLKTDLDEFMKKEKFSILYISIKNYQRIVDCYGFDYSNRVVRNTAMYLKEYFNTENVYHYYKDIYFVILDGINDLRTVEKKCLELIDYLRLNVNKNTSRIEARFVVGALRYKSQTLIKDKDLLLDYVSFASKKALSSPNSFAYFDIDLYKEDFNETSLVANINEAIDNNKIGVSYNQVIDLKNMTTAFYRVKPIIPSLDATSKEIIDIINLRGLSLKLEILMIRKAISEILKVFEKKKRYVRLSINVSYDTILHKEFISFMKRLVVDNKLPKGLIIFDLVGKMKDITKEVEALSNMGIRFMSGYIEDCMLININYFRVSYLLPHLNTPKGQAVLESLKKMSAPLDLKLIIDGIKKDEISYLKEYEIDLVSYGKDILLDDILKKMED